MPRQMRLGVFAVGTGNHSAGWRMPGADRSNQDPAVLMRIAAEAERAKYDMFFIADGLHVSPTDHPSFIARIEPVALVSALSQTTRHIGLGASIATTYAQPFTTARQFASIDHLSGGRAGVNIITGANLNSGANFGRIHPPHAERYEIAEEFVDVLTKLWDSWEDGAIIADAASGRYVDTSKLHVVDHVGKHFQVQGPLNAARCPQGRPVIIQAGGSPAGQALAARTADVVFAVAQDLGEARENYTGFKRQVVAFGRDPGQVHMLPGVMPILGRDPGAARALLAQLQSFVGDKDALKLVEVRLGHDISGYPLDGPVPEFGETQGGRSMARALFALAKREGMTLRDLYNLVAAARGHLVLTGTPTMIADTLEEWFTTGAADGFIMLPAWFPGAFVEFNETVLPILRHRGLFRQDYTGITLRDHLGLVRP